MLKSRISIFFISLLSLFIVIAGLVAWIQKNDLGKIDWLYCIVFSIALAVVGGVIAVIALPSAKDVEAKAPSRILLWIRVMMVGLLITLAGGAIAFTLSYNVGYWLCVAGAIPFFVGMIAYFFNLICSPKHKSDEHAS